VQRAIVTTNEIDIPRIAHDPVVLKLPVVGGLGDPARERSINALLTPDLVLGESLDDVRAEAKEIKSADDLPHGVQGCTYEVTYDDHGVLQIDVAVEWMGAYPSVSGFHVVIDLEKGLAVHARDAFRASSLGTLVTKLDPRVVAEAKSSAAAKDPDWASLVADAHFTADDLEHFSVGDDGVTFSHDWAFPHAALALQPEGTYLVAWKDLQADLAPDGPLVRIARAQK